MKKRILAAALVSAPFCPAAVPALRWICRMRSQTGP